MKYENRWKPKLTDQYYYIDECTTVKNTVYSGDGKDRSRILCGNCFRYIRDAHKVQAQYRLILRGAHENELLSSLRQETA